MAIIKTELISDIQQAHGSRHIHEQRTDHLGRIFDDIYSIPSDGNLADISAVRVVQMNNNLVAAEINKIVCKVQDGFDIPKLEFATAAEVKLTLQEKQQQLEEESGILTVQKSNVDKEVNRG